MRKQNNLVPRVSSLPAPRGRKRRDPGNEVVNKISRILDWYKYKEEATVLLNTLPERRT